ncbi:cytochrome C oxidase subunit IV family protein [Gordonia sp. CPCC 206044]|uniref:cytochrome C oxidase subunit IV family protein n=1 Tax=Gordonia sp. CPCC 206044 TaxID=3140793 RepID=UPI003AF338DD
MTLNGILGPRYVRTWLLLVLLAVVTPIISRQLHAETPAVVIVLALAAYKVRLVGLDFMEIRQAPRSLRWAFEAYCIALFVVVTGAYLVL